MRISALAGLLVGTMTITLGGTAIAQTKTTLRIGHVTSLQAIAGQGSSKLKEVAEKVSNGEIEVQIFPNSQLGGELEMVSQVRLGTLDMVMAGSGIVAAIEPTFSITELPYIWKSRESAWKVLNGPVGSKMFALLDPKGIKALSWGVWDMRGFLTNGFAVAKPDDLKGKKIRVIENPLYVRTIRAYNGNPVPMAWPEVYSALQQKTIDGVETNYHGMADSKLYEVAKSLTVSDHIWTATVFMINKKKFESLPPKLQDAISQAAKEAGETMFVNAGKANDDAIALMEKNGVKILRPERADFEKTIDPVHKYFSNLVDADLLEEVKAAQK
jgi:tripartite ATP-independent transporter DctP family solute receptor